MRTGLVYSSSKRQGVYYRLKRQVVTEYKLELEQATGWKRDWIRWKRSMAVEIRYNQLLFSEKKSHSSIAQTHVYKTAISRS